MRKHNINVKAALAVFAIVLSACSSDNDIVDNNSTNQEKTAANKSMTFHASMDGITTRTNFNSNNTVWTKDDKISILNTASVNEECPEKGVFTIGEPANGKSYTKEETFSGTKIKANGNNNDQFYAFYPADADNFTNTNGTVKMTATLPVVQTPIDGTYDQSLHFMSAYSTNSTFAFKNVCALLKITLTDNPTSEDANPVCRVKVVANPTLSAMDAQKFTYTSIAGNFEATVNTDGIATAIPKLAEDEVEKTFVELRAASDNGTAKTSLGNGTFYMVVLPATISNGFTLLLEKKDGTIYQRINTKITSFDRNQMYNLGTYNCSSTPTDMTSLGNDVVDLDLPSGTIWCKKNVTKSGTLGSSKVNGFASAETEYGDYFSWGKTYFTGRTLYGSTPSHPDYTLANQYDAVYSYNQKYCMPIYAQAFELANGTYESKTSSTSGNGGARLTTATGRSIFLPYGGHYYSTVTSLATGASDDGSEGDYWTRTFYGRATINNFAYCLDWKHSNNIPIIDNHSGADLAIEWADNIICGRTIRPVITNNQIAPIK